MTEKKCDGLIDYFNQALSKHERKQFEQHLATCSECQEELQELEELTSDLPYLSEEIPPPVGMKKRVLANVFQQDMKETTPNKNKIRLSKPIKNTPTDVQSEKPGKVPWIFSTIAALLFISLIGNMYLLSMINETETPNQTLAIDQLVKTVELQPTNGEYKGTASLVLKNGTLNVVIQAQQLQSLKKDHVYQVWLIEGDKPYRAGTFIPDAEGKGAVSFSIDYEGEHTWDTVAISIEPSPTSETPLGEVILASEL
ncbi:anti-sigma factor [Bacillus timonensis]|nr:anti-sigma factor [Bacillus timonensis]